MDPVSFVIPDTPEFDGGRPRDITRSIHRNCRLGPAREDEAPCDLTCVVVRPVHRSGPIPDRSSQL